MKRIIKVLTVSALMVVLMATTVSPAFAAANPDSSKKGEGWHFGHERGYQGSDVLWCGHCDSVFGTAHGNPVKTGYYGY